jgi:hypothetical protein
LTRQPNKIQKETKGKISAEIPAENSTETAGNVVPLKQGQEVTKPYEPTAEEAAALARHKKRGDSRLPSLKCDMTAPDEWGNRVAQIAMDHPDLEVGYRVVADAFNIGDMTLFEGVVHDISGLGRRDDGGPDMKQANYAIAIIKGIKPKDTAEVLLASQMAAIQIATLKTASLFGASKTRENLDLYERSLNRLSRTFVAQMEALKRYRSKGNQRIVVERVNVSEGGQAIVGNVNRGEAE